MLDFRDLEDVPISVIHSAFIDAFADYEVQMDMPLEKLAEMLDTRGYSGRHSIGCFDGGRLVGFSLSGFRVIDGQPCCYDTGTGIIREYQNMKIGNGMIGHLVGHLKSLEIELFILEVLENNTAARRIYEKNGFLITRRLLCYEHAGGFPDEETAGYSFSGEDKLPGDLNEKEYCSFEPSWQNRIISYQSRPDRHRVFTLRDGRELAAYAVVNTGSGYILQLGISPALRGRGLESMLLGRIHSVLNRDRYVMLNIEEASPAGKVLEELGFTNFVSQYEMSMKIG